MNIIYYRCTDDSVTVHVKSDKKPYETAYFEELS